MAESKTDQLPAAARSIPGDDPPASATISGEEKLNTKDIETDHDRRKRKKNCPSALDELKAMKSSSNSGFSFAFDTEVGGAPEFTPRFGHFNSAASSGGGEKPEKRDPDTIHQHKRRKNCPGGLDGFETIKSSSNSSFSFCLDTESGSAPVFTPKFGSFNSATAAAEIDRSRQSPVGPPAREEKDGKEDDEVSKERREIVESSADGFGGVD